MHGAGAISISDAVSKSSSEPKKFVDELREVVNGSRTLNRAEIESRRKDATAFCTTVSNECGCTLLCALAVITDDAQARLDALERVYIWGSNERDNIRPKIQKHLANFYFGKIGDAIDAAEHALGYCRNRPKDTAVIKSTNSIISSLAYYYAELIGTDEGNERGAHKKAIEYRDESKSALRDMNIIDDTTKDWPELIAELLDRLCASDPSEVQLLSDTFNVIDNAIFVEIQTATNADRAREVLKWLDRLKSARPELSGLAELSHDLHTHYAQLRLLELQAQEAGSI